MNKCKNCSNVIIQNKYGRISRFCSRKCYYQWYYKTHKEQCDNRRKQWHKKHYIPHPIISKFSTEEECKQHKKDYQRQYYEQHKDYYKQKNREWYKKHKNDPELKRKQSIAMKKYYKKKVSRNNERF